MDNFQAMKGIGAEGCVVDRISALWRDYSRLYLGLLRGLNILKGTFKGLEMRSEMRLKQQLN